MNDKIPKKIYQSWKTKDIGGNMLEAVNKVKALNPEYEHHLYDDQDCRDFLLNNFGKEYLIAFDNLIPGAYKCDFWRYAILYLYGGIYVDIDLIPLVPFNQMIDPEDEFVSVVDRPNGTIYQAFIACIPRHPILLNCLELSFYNILSKKIDISSPWLSLSYTGPIVAGQAFHIYMKNEDTQAQIKPKKYGNINLDYIFGISSLGIIKKSTGKKMFDNKYENYESVNNYRINAPYKNINNAYIDRIKIITIVLIVVLIMLFIFYIIYRQEFIKCKASCLSIIED
jgi:mannosyltransferase OCH1-like enzyme